MSLPNDSTTKICPECGAAFVPRHASQICCSEECRRNRVRRQNRHRHSGDKDEGPIACAIRESKLISNETIMKARKKPVGISPVRWRIELRRRAAKALYDNKFSSAPDPDLLPATPLG